MISYSDRAQPAYRLLYRPYNDIDIYVEDTTCRNMYEILVNRLLDGKGRIHRIFQVGNRKAVEDACRDDQADAGRPKLYIVDSDMDLLRGKRRPKLRNLYRLKAYCAENLLIDEGAFVEILRESLTNHEEEEIKQRLGFRNVEAAVNGILLELWILYAIIFQIKLSLPTVSYSVMRLVEQNEAEGIIVSRPAVRARMRQIGEETLALNSKARYLVEKRKVKQRVRRLGLTGMTTISGKDYILPILHSRCKKRGNYRAGLNSLKVALARYCRLDIDPGLRTALRRQLRYQAA